MNEQNDKKGGKPANAYHVLIAFAVNGFPSQLMASVVAFASCYREWPQKALTHPSSVSRQTNGTNGPPTNAKFPLYGRAMAWHGWLLRPAPHSSSIVPIASVRWKQEQTWTFVGHSYTAPISLTKILAASFSHKAFLLLHFISELLYIYIQETPSTVLRYHSALYRWS